MAILEGRIVLGRGFDSRTFEDGEVDPYPDLPLLGVAVETVAQKLYELEGADWAVQYCFSNPPQWHCIRSSIGRGDLYLGRGVTLLGAFISAAEALRKYSDGSDVEPEEQGKIDEAIEWAKRGGDDAVNET